MYPLSLKLKSRIMAYFEFFNRIIRHFFKFGGSVRQFILDHLAPYVKGVNQLKIGLWQGEVSLEKLELNLDAFDCLQLPFALKTGQVGKLCVKIPWKNLGWGPLIVTVEDVLICICQHKDNETADFVETKELGAKLAKLNVIKSMKFSKRVSDNPVGRSFLSFIYSKVLDKIQISIKDVHLIFIDTHYNEGSLVLGLRFSTLNIMNESPKQSATMTTGGKGRTGQVNKKVEILKFGIYCNSAKKDPSALGVGGSISSLLCCDVDLDNERYNYLINPFGVSISISINTSGKLDCAPQYSIVADISALVLSLNDLWLRQMFGLLDYFSICLLRKRYGRYRPPQISLSKKIKGWQRMWWKYAQESVLSDIRQKSRTSSNNFRRRGSNCRRYANSYKRKFELLNQEQLVSKDFLSEFEKMDKEYDSDDIVDFRCVAVEELQEHVNSSFPTIVDDSTRVQEGQRFIDRCESRARSWLNWSSLGMFGAGRTTDSSSFAGVVSDKIIEDTYDATKSHSLPYFSGNSLARNRYRILSVQLNIGHIVSTFTTGRLKKKFANANFNRVNVETNVWTDSVAVHTLVSSAKIINTVDDIILSPTKMGDSDERSLMHVPPFIDIQVHKTHPSQTSEISIKVMIQPFEATYVSDFFQDMIHFCDVSTSFQNWQRTVLNSLNGFRSFKSRVLSKKEYILANRAKLNWHICLEDAVIKFPLKTRVLDYPILTVGLGGVSFDSDNVPQVLDMNHNYDHSCGVCTNDLEDDMSSEILLDDLYDCYSINLTGLEVYILYGNKPGPTSVIDKTNVSIGFGLCIFVDEPKVKALKVNCTLPSAELHLSPTSMHALVGVYGISLPDYSEDITIAILDVTINGCTDMPHSFQFSVSVYLAQVSINMWLEKDLLNSSVICCMLCSADFRYSMQKFPKCDFCVKLLKVDEMYQNEDLGSCEILSSKNNFCSPTQTCVEHVGPNLSSREDSKVGCFTFQYHVEEEGCILKHKYFFSLSDAELHVYPKLFGLLQRFFGSFNIQSYAKENKNSDTINIELSKLGIYGESNISTPTQENYCPFATKLDTHAPNSLKSSPVSCVTSETQSPSVLEQQHNVQSPKFQPILTAEDYATETTLLNADICDIYILKINLSSLHVHFHDSSCILGTITLAKSRTILSCDERECLDAHISTERLGLSSCWMPPIVHKQLWGPVSPDISPVLKIHVRKQKADELFSTTEIRFVIQHVCCILPLDYLHMLIGYFSLPDWTSDGQLMDELDEKFGEKQSKLFYKFEILQSRLLVPVESLKNFCPQFELSELCISFIPASKVLDTDKDIPSCCKLPATTNVDHFDIINLFGRTCSFSLIPLKDNKNFLLKPDECFITTSISLMEQLNIDIWIRVPFITVTSKEQSPFPGLIMVKLYKCNIFAEERYLDYGVQAISSIVDEMTLIGEASKLFTCDVSQFFILRKVLKNINTVTVKTSNNSFISLKICADAVSVNLYRCSITQSTLSEMVAKADLQFNIVSSVKQGMLQSMEVCIPSIDLWSHSSNLLLASVVSDIAIGSSLRVKFFQTDHRNKQIFVEVPFLDIWLHFSEWENFIDTLGCYFPKSDNASSAFNANQEPIINDFNDSFVPLCSTVKDKIKNGDLTIRSESSRFAIHIPICDKDNLTNLEENEPSDNCKYVQLSLAVRYCQFTECGAQLKLKCVMENVRITLEIGQGQNIRSFPFIIASQINLESSVHKIQELIHFIIDIKLESVDIEFYYQILKFWSSSQLILPGISSSKRHPSHTITCHVHLLKASVLFSDERSGYHCPMFEILTKKMLVDFEWAHDTFEGSVNSEFVVNYNNIDMVMWESFIEPSHIHLTLARKASGMVVLDSSTSTNLYLQFTSRLNLNVTDHLVEVMFIVHRMIDDIFNQSGAGGLQESQKVHGFQPANKYAPYIIQNDTSIPFKYRIFCDSSSSNDIHCVKNDGNVVQPGHAVPIFIEELDAQYFHHKSAYFSERLIYKKIHSFRQYMISIQLEGTTGPSKLMSMDVAGLNYFEVNFSVNKKQPDAVEFEMEDDEARYIAGQSGLVASVVIEVSMQHYSKTIRLYSTVILSNATSMPLELRFDVPFQISPRVLGPILPGQEIPLPLHLTMVGQISWRPLGNKYLWNEAHSLSNIFSQEYRLKFLRSFACYPVHRTSHPFFCCISTQDYNLPTSNSEKNQSLLGSCGISRGNITDVGRSLQTGLQKKQSVRLVRLTTPLLVKNYLPVSLSLMIESGGVTHTISIKEEVVVSVSLVDSTNDLGITFHMQGYIPVGRKFPRAEYFSSIAKLNGSMFCVSETLALCSETSSGPTHVILEKAMDASSGAREICLYVPFLVYNCTGLVLSIVESIPEKKGIPQVIPSTYHLFEHEHHIFGKQGLPILSLESDTQNMDVNSPAVSIRRKTHLNFNFPSSPGFVSCGPANKVSGSNKNANCFKRAELSEVKPHMYSPTDFIHTSEPVVKLCVHTSHTSGNALYGSWSNPFSLVHASGSTTVNIPKPKGSGAFLTAATSFPIAEESTGRSTAIILQPRYVICNTCNKDLFYKQIGTDDYYHLSSGEHSHLHLSDTSRELYVSLRFNEPGSQWSGSFLPDCLGDVRLKINNSVYGRLYMVRVEIQIADMVVNVENTNKCTNGLSSTHLILLSDDDSGYMPYRIDNFTMERLRVYQQGCEFFETIIHPYSSMQYAWDEPCNSHSLVIAAPGEKIIGIYSLDCIQDHQPLIAEKGDMQFSVSVHGDGAIKVLSIIDSDYHLVKKMKEIALVGSKGKKKTDEKLVAHANYTEIITVHVPFIGISLINSTPKELVFVNAKESTISVMQSRDEQKLLFQILNLQIDNQFLDTPYPILLSFKNEHRGGSTNSLTSTEHSSDIENEKGSPSTYNTSNECVFYFSAAKWRKVEASLVSFKYMSLRLASLCIELEEQVLLSMIEFLRSVSTRLQSRNLQKNIELHKFDVAGNAVKFSVNRHERWHICRIHNNACSYNKGRLLPSIIPIGAPWQNMCFSARKQKKINIELFEVSPINFSLSITSTPWLFRNEDSVGVDDIVHSSSYAFLRSLVTLVALADVEEVQVQLGELVISHLMASGTAVREFVTAHYTRQLLHEMYKRYGSAGVIARNIGVVIIGLIANTVYALSSATTQFTKTDHKGMTTFTFDEQAFAEMDAQLKDLESRGKGILSEFLEGLTGLLQSPLRGAERHGPLGVLPGIIMGVAGIVARPVASILEATGKTAEKIKKQRKANRLRIRFPRPLAREVPLLPYSWEEAIGASILLQADRSRLKDEALLMCKSLKQSGKFIVISERHVCSVFCSCLVDLGSPQFAGVPSNPEWTIEMDVDLESIMHVGRITDDAVNVVGSRKLCWKSTPTSSPLVYMKVELKCSGDAEQVLQFLVNQVEKRKQGKHLQLHRWC